jgi:hypothetical protein
MFLWSTATYLLGQDRRRPLHSHVCSVLLQVTWVGLTSLAFNRWITREELIERGFEKLVNEIDGKKAAAQQVSCERDARFCFLL